MKLTFEALITMSFESTVVGDSLVSSGADFGFRLIPDENVIEEDFINDTDFVTEQGAEMLTDMFTAGLIALMSYSDQKGYVKDHAFLKKVISDLEEALMSPAEVSERKKIRE